MRLTKVERPKGELEKSGKLFRIDHKRVLQGYYDEDGNYYEHNLVTGLWYLLDYEDDEDTACA